MQPLLGAYNQHPAHTYTHRHHTHTHTHRKVRNPLRRARHTQNNKLERWNSVDSDYSILCFEAYEKLLEMKYYILLH